MIKYKTIIIDDIPANIAEIKRITEQDERFEIVATANNGVNGLKEITTHNPDLVLLDIEMPVMGGFDLVVALKEFPDFNPVIVFITVYNQFAIQAIRHSAFDYILKTSMEEYLPQALNKFALGKTDRNLMLGEKIETLISSLESNKQILVRSHNLDVFIRPSEIVYISTNKNRPNSIFMQNGDCVSANQTLVSIEVILPGRDFFRLGKRHIINVKYIREIRNEIGFLRKKFVYMQHVPDSERLLIPGGKYPKLIQFINDNHSPIVISGK